ncbi:MAG: hypothetical protein ACOX63_02915 [Christensenellales bacterium]|jgi:hypothetical protein
MTQDRKTYTRKEERKFEPFSRQFYGITELKRNPHYHRKEEIYHRITTDNTIEIPEKRKIRDSESLKKEAEGSKKPGISIDFVDIPGFLLWSR